MTEGTAGDDTIAATDGIVNRIRGLEGDDLLFGSEENDLISGQDGDDIFVIGAGDDLVDMGGGDDLAYLGDGDDRNGGNNSGSDTTYGGAGDDTLSDSSGSDLMFGEEGNDRFFTAERTPYTPTADSQFDDTLVGGAGNDSFEASVSDLIFGSTGADDITIVDGGGEGPAVIADFDLDEDTLVIQYEDRPGFATPYTQAPEVIFEYDPQREGASVSFNGAERVFLYNINENDMAELRNTTRIISTSER